MDVVADLLALVAEHRVRPAGRRALHEVGEEAVQLARREWPGPVRQPPRKHAGPHAEVAAVLLHHHVGRHLGRAEQAVLAGVDAHRLVDAVRANG